MEKKPQALGTWKLFLVGCFCGGLISLLFIDRTQQNASLLAANNALLQFNPFSNALDQPTTNTSTTVPSALATRSVDVDVPPPIISTTIEPNATTTNPPEVPSPIISTIIEPNVTAHPSDVLSSIISPISKPNITTRTPEITSPIISPILQPEVAIHSPEVPPLIISPIAKPNITTRTPEVTFPIISPPVLQPEVVIHSPEVLPSIISPVSVSNFSANSIEKPMNQTKTECDIFDGRWVYNADYKPSYNAVTCPYIEVGVKCQENGRSDLEYEKWRWEATDCDIPLFSGKDFLERLRNKRMIIVGDSINRNMWESLACLIYSSVPSSGTEGITKDAAHRFLKAKDYNFTVEFFMSPFLTELDHKHKSGRKVLILDNMSHFAKMWRGADIMLFNSGHWWTHNDNIKAWELFQYKGKLTEDMPREIAFKRAMRTWASWIKKNVDQEKTSVFFRSVSPTHDARKYDQWCYNVTQPIKDESYVMRFPKALIGVVESMIPRMSKLRVKYLNITKLSEYRIDAHPSIYTNKLKGNIPGSSDCSHWCLPGLPDTWNRLLYASVLYDINL